MNCLHSPAIAYYRSVSLNARKDEIFGRKAQDVADLHDPVGTILALAMQYSDQHNEVITTRDGKLTRGRCYETC